MNVKKDIRFRVYIAFTAICLLGLLIIVKAARIQIKEGAELRAKAYDLHMRPDTVASERGNIVTEDGHLLCSSIPQFDLRLDFSVMQADTFSKDVPAIAAGLSRILGDATPKEYQDFLVNAHADKKHFYYCVLKNKVPYDKYIAIRSLPLFNKGRRGGLLIEPDSKRINPYEMLARRTIGLWRKNAQMVGLEAAYDSLLEGEDGSRILQKMPGGVYMPVEGSEIEPQNGSDIVTTLDLSIQNVAEDALLSVLQKYECMNGTAIVMEVKTGKIRALVNLGRDSATGRYFENENYALTRAEPGSTFKLTTLMSLLNDGLIKVDDIVDCEGGAIRFGNRVMKDSHLGLGRITIRDAYAHSSNAAMAKLAYEHYYKDPEKYMHHLEAFGVDKRTGIDIGGEQKPHVIKPGMKDWNSTTLPWMATGYGILITPLRTCMLYNGIANGGKMMKPYLVSSVREYGKDVTRFEPTVVMEKMGDSSAVAQMQSCMREVVISGTGKAIESPYYNIAGKTGTAQVADKIGGKWYPYSAGIYQGSFVGFFPYEQPRYTICVVIRTKPHSGAYYGGTLAAPVFRMIADKIFATGMGSWKGPLDSLSKTGVHPVIGQSTTCAAYHTVLQKLGIPDAPGQLQQNAVAQITMDSSRKISLNPKAGVQGFVPDVTGMSLRDAIYLLEVQGMHVQLQGSGLVKTQSVAPGSRAVKGQSIILQLS